MDPSEELKQQLETQLTDNDSANADSFPMRVCGCYNICKHNPRRRGSEGVSRGYTGHIPFSLVNVAMDEQLCQLIRQVLQNPDGSPDQKQAMDRLLGLIPKLPKIYRHNDSRIDYQEVLNEALEGVSLHGENVTKQHLSTFLRNYKLDINSEEAKVVRQNFVKWFNGILRNQINEQYRGLLNQPWSLDAPIKAEEATTFGEILPDVRTIGDLESWCDRQDLEITRLKAYIIELYIERDPQGRLRGCCYKDRDGNENPNCNCQLLFRELYLTPETEPKIRIADIARRFGIPYITISSRLLPRCLKILREVEQEIEKTSTILNRTSTIT